MHAPAKDSEVERNWASEFEVRTIQMPGSIHKTKQVFKLCPSLSLQINHKSNPRAEITKRT